MLTLPDVPENETVEQASMLALPDVPENEIVEDREASALALPSLVSQIGVPEFSLSKATQFEELPPLPDTPEMREINARNFMKQKRLQEEREERRNILIWSSIVSAWVCVWLIFFILICVYWKAVVDEQEYYDEEVAGVCEEIYTKTQSPAPFFQYCVVEISAYDCADSACQKLQTTPESVFLDRTAKHCAWSSSMFGRYRCWYLREGGKIDVDSLHTTQHPGVDQSKFIFAIIGSCIVFLMGIATAVYIRIAWNDWDEFGSEPWNRYNYVD